LFYEKSRQRIIGYEDLGHPGRFPKRANHALIVMVRGARTKLKDTVSSERLKQILLLAVQKLESINLHVLTTICDQGPTNMKPLIYFVPKLFQIHLP
jgi:hypothetical protein